VTLGAAQVVLAIAGFLILFTTGNSAWVLGAFTGVLLLWAISQIVFD
jgi:hypothetical protein